MELMLDARTVNGPSCQNRRQIGIRLASAGDGESEALATDIFEAGEQLEAQQMAEGKSDLTLTMAIDILLLYRKIGTMAQHPFQHRRHLRRGDRLELGVDADRFVFHMPIDHHPTPKVAQTPFGH